MKINQQLKIKQNQSIVMTPQLQQAIKLLLSRPGLPGRPQNRQIVVVTHPKSCINNAIKQLSSSSPVHAHLAGPRTAKYVLLRTKSSVNNYQSSIKII